MRLIMSRGGHIGERSRSLGEGAHGHQHTPNVGVRDDRDRPWGTFNGATLYPFTGERNRLLIGPVGHGNALQTNRKAGRVHHDEHIFEAAVFLAHQPGNGAGGGCSAARRRERVLAVPIKQHGGWTRFDAKFVFNRRAINVVPSAQAAIVVRKKFWYHKKRQALHALGGSGYPRQHMVDDVFGQVVFTVGDVDLLAKQAIGAIGLGFGARAHLCQVAAGLRLGEVHGAGPLTTHHWGYPALLQGLVTGGEKRLDGPVGQERAQRERQVGGVQHLRARRRDRLRQPHAAKVRGVLHALPAALRERPKRFRKTSRRLHGALLPLGRRLIAGPVERRDDFLIQARRLFEHGANRFVSGFGKPRQRLQRRQTGEFPQHKHHLGDWGHIGHRSNPSR